MSVFIVGDSGVGKSSIINQLLGWPFMEEHRPTIGIDFMYY